MKIGKHNYLTRKQTIGSMKECLNRNCRECILRNCSRATCEAELMRNAVRHLEKEDKR